MNLKERVLELESELIQLRREFHRMPELGFEEFKTSEKIYNYLQKLGLEVEKITQTGVVGLLEGEKSGKTVMLRADMDALPVKEATGLDFASENDGVMHACGHDGHMAMLLITAKILAENKDKIAGKVKFVFQPNEEEAGAKYMVADGVLKEPTVDAVFGIHLWAPINAGTIGVSAGPFMGLHENFVLKIKGQGGHSGNPHTAVDPFLPMANIIQSVQMIQTREIDILKPTLIMFGQIEGGTAPNIIPGELKIKGSMRYLYQGGDDSKECPEKRFERIVNNICQAHRASYELEFFPSNSTLINDPETTEIVKAAAVDVFGAENLINYVCMAGEDFAEFTAEVPGTFYFIGAGNKEKDCIYPHHHPKFDIDEDVLTLGVEMHLKSVFNFLD
ncbi:MAG: M20 family metallopeptidase [Bacillota bacterium]